MNPNEMLIYLHNSGLTDAKIVGDNIVFSDPSCIFPVFDKLLDIGWIAILILTVFMLTGWAMLYIKNGVNINNLFNNAKTIILIFCVLSIVKPIVNVIYGDDLFGHGCEQKQVSVASVNELLEMRHKTLAKSDDAFLYESFDVIDSGVKLNEFSDTDDDEYEPESDE